MKEIIEAPAVATPSAVSGLQAEWLDSQPGSGKAATLVANQAAGSAPGKDVADRLDGELKQFAASTLDHPSANMLDFQKLVGKFEDAPDKKQGMQDLDTAASRLQVKMTHEAAATNTAIEAAAAKVPGRGAAEDDLSAKTDKFFDAESSLPPAEHERVLNLLQWQQGETRDQRDQRVHDGLNNPALLKSFDQMEAAAAKIDKSLTPLEQQLQQQHDRQMEETDTVYKIVNEAFIRSEIPN